MIQSAGIDRLQTLPPLRRRHPRGRAVRPARTGKVAFGGRGAAGTKTAAAALTPSTLSAMEDLMGGEGSLLFKLALVLLTVVVLLFVFRVV